MLEGPPDTVVPQPHTVAATKAREVNARRMLVFGHGIEEDGPWDGTSPRFNTLPSFSWLRDQGVDGVELDVRLTADDVPVVVHDSAVSGRLVRETTRDELPAEIPDLADALDVCRGMTVIVELKNFPQDDGFDPSQRLVHHVLALLADRQWDDDVVLSSFGTDALAVVRREAPHVRTAALLFGREPDPTVLRAVVDAGHRLAHPYDPMVDAAFVDAAHRLGLSLDVWLLEVPPERYGELAALGVHGVITSQVTEALSARDLAAARCRDR
jgi:glycerophosphoryl diester phosphodiesterase